MGDASYAEFSSKLSPGIQLPILGVRLPQLRKMARKYARREDWRDIFFSLLKPQVGEEQMLCGFLLGYACRDIGEFCTLLDKFMPLIDGWAVCDCCCASFRLISRHREVMWPVLVQYMESGDTFRQRFAVVATMWHYCTEEHAPQVLAAYAQLSPVGYYAEMGLAWALSVFLLHAPNAVLQLLREKHWSDNVRLLACRKMLESRRTPTALRAEIQLLRQSIKKGGQLPQC